jgi:hypothetical protein
MKGIHGARVVFAVVLVSYTVLAQGVVPQTSGIDISGSWVSGGANTEISSAETQLVDYGGVPMSEAGRFTP